jgi:hypothetical protein
VACSGRCPMICRAASFALGMVGFSVVALAPGF